MFIKVAVVHYYQCGGGLNDDASRLQFPAWSDYVTGLRNVSVLGSTHNGHFIIFQLMSTDQRTVKLTVPNAV
jgi:hypothetical protein